MRELKGIQYDNQSKAKARPKSPQQNAKFGRYGMTCAITCPSKSAPPPIFVWLRASGVWTMSSSLGDLSAQQAYRVIEALKARLTQEVATFNVNNQEAPF